jgi:GGDEF domain-containing protein
LSAPRQLSSRPAPSPRRPVPALVGAVLLTAAIGVLDVWAGGEVSVLALYLVPAALAGWHVGRRGALAVALLGAAAWLAAERLEAHPYSHAVIPYINAVGRLAIFAAFGTLAAELRRARERPARLGEDDALPAGDSFYRMLEREHARLLRHGRPVTLAYVDAGGVRPEGAPCGEPFAGSVLEALRRTLRATDVVARPRGKEFALLLADTGPDAARVALERLRGVLAALTARQGVTCSLAIGAVSCAAPAGDLNRVIQRAYQLMYEAERSPGQVAVSLERFEAAPAAPADS